MLLFACFLLLSCGLNDDKTGLEELEKAIEGRESQVLRFEAHMDSIKRAVPIDVSDSLLWEHYYDMYEVYRYINIDTVFRYVYKLEDICVKTKDKDQISLTQGAKVRLMRSYTEDFIPAVNLFESMDTIGLKKSTKRKYYSVGVTLYMAFVEVCNEEHRDKYKARLKQLRQEYKEQFFDYSVHCRLMTAIAHYDYGEYEEAMSILHNMLEYDNLTIHERTQVQYYLSKVYSNLGRRKECKELLIHTAIQEMNVPVRDYLALHDLAIMLNEEKDYLRASQLISVATSDAIAINFYSRLRRASDAQSYIAEAAYNAEHHRRKILQYFIVAMCFAFILVVILLYHSFHQRTKLRRAYKIVASTNSRLEATNAELKDANLIKDNYVLRYMKLSTYYIRQVDETRNEIRRSAKSGGLEAVMALLRTPRYADEEYKRFFQIFDEAFIGLFPQFVEKVNDLLPEDSHFAIKRGGGLCTEMRILAIIRLGITRSPEIAEVLNCSVNTVYKYRETLRNKALCPKEDFEKLVRRINF